MHGGVLKQYAYAINKIANRVPEFKNMSNPPQLDLLLRYQEEYMADPKVKKDPSYPYYKLLQKYKLAFDDTFSSNYNEDIFNVVSALVEGKDSLSFPKYSMLSERLVNPSYKGNVKDRALEILTALYLLYDVIKGIDDDKVLVGIDKVAEFIKSIPKDLNKKLDALITTVAIEFGEEQWDMMAVIAKRKAGFKEEGLIYLDKERTRNVVKELVAKPAFKQYANILNQYLDDYDVLAEYTRLKQTLPSNINHMSMEECKTFADAADNIVVRCTHDDIRKKMLVDIKIYRDAYLREKMPYIFSITELLSKILVNKRQEEEAKQRAIAEEEARQRAIADEEAQMRGEEDDAETEDNSTEEELVQPDTEIPIDEKVVQKEPVPSVTAKQLTGRELFLSKYGDAAETFESKKGTSMFKGLFKIVMGGFIVPTIICGMIPPIALAWPALIIYYFWRLHKKNNITITYYKCDNLRVFGVPRDPCKGS
jgi:hypothetical protein